MSDATGGRRPSTGWYESVRERRLILSGDPAGLCFGLAAIRSAVAETAGALQRLSAQWSDNVRR
ncbi:MAG: hypothetical protein SNJ74_07210, partial [Fimbriimonadaceae bacterium]